MVFPDNAVRLEATRLSVYAIGQMTDKGEEISCAELLDGSRQLDEVGLQIAQQTELPLPTAEGQAPLLVQVPQARYLFLAHAHDRFGFLVAQGCAEDSVTSQRPLDLRLALAAIGAPRGRLEPAGETAWLQPASSPGLEGARALEVITLDERGRPQPGVEVRVLVERGIALPLAERFLTAGEQAHGGTVCMLGEGPVRVLLHARGLEGSPLRFDLVGLKSPSYTAYDIETPLWEGVEMFQGDVYVDAQNADDLGLMLIDPATGKGHARYWAGGRSGAEGWSVETPELLTWNDGANWLQPTHAVAGNYDDDCMEATGPCAQMEDLVVTSIDPVDGAPGLNIQHHNTFAGDRLRPLVPEALPWYVRSIEQLLSLRVNHDDLDDVALVVATDDDPGANARAILVYTTQRVSSAASVPALVLRQRIDIPDPLGDLEAGRVWAADLDGDGDDELLLAYDFSGLFIVPCFGELGDGAMPYAPASGDASAWPQLASYWGDNLLATADVDEDGHLDLVVVNIPESINNPITLRVVHGTGALETCPVTAPGCGALSFGAPLTLDRAAVGSVGHLLTADLNGDGHVDVIAAGAERAALLAGDGSGRFSTPLIIPLNLRRLKSVAATPLDLDAAADLGFFGTDHDGVTVFKVRLTGGD